jgi:hypothetical protein
VVRSRPYNYRKKAPLASSWGAGLGKPRFCALHPAVHSTQPILDGLRFFYLPAPNATFRQLWPELPMERLFSILGGGDGSFVVPKFGGPVVAKLAKLRAQRYCVAGESARTRAKHQITDAVASRGDSNP